MTGAKSYQVENKFPYSWVVARHRLGNLLKELKNVSADPLLDFWKFKVKLRCRLSEGITSSLKLNALALRTDEL